MTDEDSWTALPFDQQAAALARALIDFGRQVPVADRARLTPLEWVSVGYAAGILARLGKGDR